jgi:hypothetical protein
LNIFSKTQNLDIKKKGIKNKIRKSKLVIIRGKESVAKPKNDILVLLKSLPQHSIF